MTVTLAKQIAGLVLIQTAALGQGGISLAASDYRAPSASVAPGQIVTLRVMGFTPKSIPSNITAPKI
jgi:hypothetical protein